MNVWRFAEWPASCLPLTTMLSTRCWTQPGCNEETDSGKVSNLRPHRQEMAKPESGGVFPRLCHFQLSCRRKSEL